MAAGHLFLRWVAGQGAHRGAGLAHLRHGVGKGRIRRMWIPPISFRIRESSEGFDEKLKLASFKGGTYEVKREDGLNDILYSQPGQRPLWVQEPTGKWRIFKYYSGEEISNFAHAFYTRIGANVLMFALTN